jgi:murein DD-endopeptidase MepM/ murein hydrolase activator NlpD
MRRFALFLAGALAALTLAPPAAQALAAPVAPGLSITIRPTEMAPAQAGFVFVSGGYPLDVATSLDGTPLDVYWTGEGYIASFAFGFEEPPGDHQIEVSATNPSTGEAISQSQTIIVSEAHYTDEYLALSLSLAPLLDADINESEEEHLAELYQPANRLLTWQWPFGLPAPGTVVTSRFGGYRSYNNGAWRSRHTGVDFRVGLGDPIHAAADGRVAAAELTDVRGNVVIIDHGYGVYSQYAHLSEAYVVVGQAVTRGQVIGAVGATGRTNGPHLHFEVIVNGQSVDPISWLSLDPQFIPPREVRPEEQTAEEGTDPAAEGGG